MSWKIGVAAGWIVAVWAAACTGSDPVSAPVVVPAEAATPVGFAISLAPASAFLRRGETTTLTVQIRRDGFTGGIVLDSPSLGPDLSFVATQIAPDATDTPATLSATVNAALGDRPIAIRARADDGSFEAAVTLTVTVAGLPGTLDEAYATGGIADIRASDRDIFLAGASAVDDAVALGGSSIFDAGSDAALLAPILGKLDRTGVTDPQFGRGGVLYPVAGQILGVLMDPQGNVSGSGYVLGADGGSRAALFQALADGGVTDPGYVVTDVGEGAVAQALVAVHDDLVAFGASTTGGLQSPTVFRYPAHGGAPQVFVRPATATAKNASFVSAVYDPSANVVWATDTGQALYRIDASALGTLVPDGDDPALSLALSGGLLVRGYDRRVFRAATSTSPAIESVNKLPVSVGALAVQADGKVLVAGALFAGSTAMCVTRLMPDGSMDYAFGDKGVTAISEPGLTLEAHALLVTATGRIIVAGSSPTGPDHLGARPSHAVVARLWQ